MNDLPAVSSVSKASASLSALVPHGRKLRLSRKARVHLKEAIAGFDELERPVGDARVFRLAADECPLCGEILDALRVAVR